jgi:hypothetical protein
MATFYLDFENGNDANDGTTFANRWKTLTTGASTVRINAGDTIRMMGSPAPTSLGQNGVWTSQALQATKTISSSTNATPIAITCSAAHGYSTGDTVYITGHTTNTNANGTWEITVTGTTTFTLDNSSGNGVGASGSARLRNNTRIKLTTPVTQNIASIGFRTTAWTASTNVTTSLNTVAVKEHYQSDNIVIGDAFTTGLAAYWPTGTLDLSGYQQVSFWINQSAGTALVAGVLELRLCSDAAGVTAVNTISIPGLVTTGWQPITVNLNTNLSSSIQSIALYVNTDVGTQTFSLNNIIACKASSADDSLTLTSLIGKNTTGETFWPIQSINGTRVMLDGWPGLAPSNADVRGYYGTSGTVTTWKRETIKLAPSLATFTTMQTIQDSGTDGNPIVFSGGWNRTDMSTQTLETWLDGVNGNGYLFHYSGKSFTSLSKVSSVRVNSTLSLTNSSNYHSISVDNVIGNRGGLFNISSGAWFCDITIGHVVAYGNVFPGVGSSIINMTINLLYGLFSLTNDGITASNSILKINGLGSGAYIANCAGSAITCGLNSSVTANNLIIQDNGSASLVNSLSTAPFHYFNNCLFNDASEYSSGGGFLTTQTASQNHDQTAGNHKIFMDGGLISAATDQRHTASGISWKLQPTSTSFRTSVRPVTLSLAKVACSANNLVTIKAWMYRNNSGLNMRLTCKGGQIAGVASDVTTSVTTTNAWEEETITFTPTETGVVEITAEAWGGTTFSGWVDDMTISQA